MTKQPHDQFAKQYLAELIETKGQGQVEVSYEIFASPRYVDLYVEVPVTPAPAELSALGLLGRMASTTCILEPFRNSPTTAEIRHCLIKLFSLHNDLQHQTKRKEDRALPEVELPYLWILTPLASSSLLNSFGAVPQEPSWPAGVYWLPGAYKTAFVVIHKLPVVPETLWLRILGRGNVQRQAVQELLAFQADDPLRNYVLELLSKWQLWVERQEHLTQDEQEELMNIERAYQEWREKTLLQGVQQGLHDGLQQGLQNGRLETQRSAIENLLKLRFGVVDEPLIDPLLKLPFQESLGWLVQRSREELIAQFGQTRPD